MATLTEDDVVIQWIYGVLAADTGAGGIAILATGGIHEDEDPRENRTYPKVIIRTQAPGYGRTLNGTIVDGDGLYGVFAVWDEASFGGNLQAMAVRIRVLLHKQSYQDASGRVLACIAEIPLKLAFSRDGISYRQRGEIFRIQSQVL